VPPTPPPVQHRHKHPPAAETELASRGR
jgi:hypothetical protein